MYIIILLREQVFENEFMKTNFKEFLSNMGKVTNARVR